MVLPAQLFAWQHSIRPVGELNNQSNTLDDATHQLNPRSPA
jgi:hypothetical protein